jgi:hypothetical protein
MVSEKRPILAARAAHHTLRNDILWKIYFESSRI